MQQTQILALVQDLIFASKIAAEARAAGKQVCIFRDPAALTQQSGSLLLVDLGVDGALDASVKWKQSTGGTVIGFVSHIDAPTIQLARQAGLDSVLPRSQFNSHLPALLRG